MGVYMSKTNYMVTLEVKTQLADSEFMCLQKVYPRIDGKNHFELQGYRFIRSQENGLLKAQRGQAQISDLMIMRNLIDEMVKKESTTII